MSRLIVILSTVTVCASGPLLPVGGQRVLATVIQPTSASGSAASSAFNIDNTRDGSNLNVAGDVLTWTHTSSTGTGDNGAWLASLSSASATYVLPAPSNIDKLYLWQYTDTASSTFNPWGTESFDIAFSTDGGADVWHTDCQRPVHSGATTRHRADASQNVWRADGRHAREANELHELYHGRQCRLWRNTLW